MMVVMIDGEGIMGLASTLPQVAVCLPPAHSHLGESQVCSSHFHFFRHRQRDTRQSKTNMEAADTASTLNSLIWIYIYLLLSVSVCLWK